jgi:histone acetyltransferase
VNGVDSEPIAGPSSRPDGYVYPPAVPDVCTIPEWAQDFKAARWISCSVDNCECEGLQPPSGATLTLGSTDVDPDISQVWQECGTCGHGWSKQAMALRGGHGFDDGLEPIERTRRRKVAGRIEELLQVSAPAGSSRCSCY